MAISSENILAALLAPNEGGDDSVVAKTLKARDVPLKEFSQAFADYVNQPPEPDPVHEKETDIEVPLESLADRVLAPESLPEDGLETIAETLEKGDPKPDLESASNPEDKLARKTPNRPKSRKKPKPEPEPTVDAPGDPVPEREVPPEPVADSGKIVLSPQFVAISQVVPTDLKPPAYGAYLSIGEDVTELHFGDDRYASRTCLDEDALKELLMGLNGNLQRSIDGYGEALFRAIFNEFPDEGGVGNSTAHGLSNIRQVTGDKFHLEIYPQTERLREHRWEYLKDPDPSRPGPMATSERVPLYRRVRGNLDYNPVKAPIRVLAIICDPPGLGDPAGGNRILEKLAPVNLEYEKRILRMAFDRLEKAGLAEFTLLARKEGDETTLPTWNNFSRAIREGFHVVHIIGHGILLEGEGFQLIMECGEGEMPFVSQTEIKELIESVDTIPLVVLGSCHSAQVETTKSLQGLGPQLAEMGVPAVISMQDALPMDTAQMFNQYFYHDLARSGRVDMAMAASRFAIRQQRAGGNKGWGIPVLQLSVKDAQLFDLENQKNQVRDLDKLKPQFISAEQLAEEEGYLQSFNPGSVISTGGVASPNFTAPAPAALPTEPLAICQNRDALSSAIRSAVALDLDARLDRNDASAGDGRSLREQVEGDQKSPFKIDDVILQQVSAALNSGKHIIFIGPPGTGKTTLAERICEFAEKHGKWSTGTTYTTASADWTTFDTVGGYIPNRNQQLEFRTGVFLDAIRKGEWLVVDEINRAEIDKAVGELFTVLSGQSVELPYKVGSSKVRIVPAKTKDVSDYQADDWIPSESEHCEYDYVVHPCWRIIGTMNVFDKSSLFRMSYAFMRRFAFIDVGVPGSDDFGRLCDHWSEGYCGVDADSADTFALDKFKEHVRSIFALKGDGDEIRSSLMKYRALGPAIARDIIRYVGNRRSRTNAEDPLELLAEAFELYAMPQFDMLQRHELEEIYHWIHKTFAGARENLLKRIRELYPQVTREEWKHMQPAEASEPGDEPEI